MRFLPSTLVIIVMGPLAGPPDRPRRPAPADDARPADRGSSRCSSSRGLTVHSGYGLLLPGFVLMGLGMGLVMSPMSTAAMNAVDRTKAGAASGVLSMSRMVGSTFGVAVMGALVTTIGRSKIDSSLPHVATATRERRSSTRSAAGPRSAATRRRRSSPRPTTRSSRRSAPACSSAPLVTLTGAVVAWTLIQRRVAAPRAVPAQDGTGRGRPEAGDEAAREISLV